MKIDQILAMNQEPRSLQATLSMLAHAKEIAFGKLKDFNVHQAMRLLNCGDEAYLYKAFKKHIFNKKLWPELSDDNM